jgi:hypothetical protein
MNKDSPNDSPYETLAKHNQSKTKRDIVCYVPSCYAWESEHAADVTGPVVLDMDIWTFGHVTSRGSRAPGERCCIGA